MKDLDGIISRIRDGDKGAISGLMRLVDDNLDMALPYLEALFPYRHSSLVLGITGASGVGKSSLIGSLIPEFVSRGFSVGVIAIDPTSPFSGGALLGDRTRMLYNLKEYGDKVYIRSIATRGAFGGISFSTYNIINILSASKKDIIIVETVGAGQGEVDIHNLSHITTLVIIPTTGDSIQVIKAGIMEIPDIFIINKIDILSSSHILRDVNEFLFKEVSSDNKKIFKVSAIKKEGIRDLVDGILEYWEFLKTTGKFEEKEKNMHIYGILKMIEHIIYKKLKSRIQNIAINGIDGGNVYTIYKNIFSEILSL